MKENLSKDKNSGNIDYLLSILNKLESIDELLSKFATRIA